MKDFYNNLTLNHFPSLYRPSSKLLISGDTFRNFSNHIFDETSYILPNKVKKNDIVFLKGSLLENYFKNYHTLIKSEYILIIHNSYEEINESVFQYIDDKIIHCFAKNLNIKASNQFSPIPVGFKNKRYLNNKYYKIANNEFYKNINYLKKNKIIAMFSDETSQERIELSNLIKDEKMIESFKNVPTHEYFEKLSTYKYSLCPTGTGLDSFRVWESLLVNTIPVVKKSNFSQNFVNLGIPMITLNSWDELLNLENKFIDINFKFDKRILSSSYWKQQVFNKKI